MSKRVFTNMPPVKSVPYAPSQRKSYLALPPRKPTLPASRRRWPILAQMGDQISSAAVHETSSAKIPKPPGEAGRPGRGGYALKTALDWPEGRYKEAQVSSYYEVILSPGPHFD